MKYFDKQPANHKEIFTKDVLLFVILRALQCMSV